jgi:hypothetical protein
MIGNEKSDRFIIERSFEVKRQAYQLGLRILVELGVA